MRWMRGAQGAAVAVMLMGLSGCPGCPYGPEEAIPLPVPADDQGHSQQYHEAFAAKPKPAKGPWDKKAAPLGVDLVAALGHTAGQLGCLWEKAKGPLKGIACDAAAPAVVDKCTLTAEQLVQGPQLPPEHIAQVHPYVEDITLHWEAGQLHAVTFVALDWVQKDELNLLSIPTVSEPMTMTTSLCRGSRWCVKVQAQPAFDKASCTAEQAPQTP